MIITMCGWKTHKSSIRRPINDRNCSVGEMEDNNRRRRSRTNANSNGCSLKLSSLSSLVVVCRQRWQWERWWRIETSSKADIRIMGKERRKRCKRRFDLRNATGRDREWKARKYNVTHTLSMSMIRGMWVNEFVCMIDKSNRGQIEWERENEHCSLSKVMEKIREREKEEEDITELAEEKKKKKKQEIKRGNNQWERGSASGQDKPVFKSPQWTR